MALREFKYVFIFLVLVFFCSFFFQYKWVINYYGNGLVLEISGFEKNQWVAGDTEGLDPDFLAKLEKLGEGIGEKVYVHSGHHHGLAADIENRAIKVMTNEELSRYGLHKPVAHKYWHIEPLE